MEFDELSNRVIGCAIEVHRHLGPGLLTYMKLAGLKIGLLMNFNVTKLKLASNVSFSDSFVLFASFVVK